ncbi:hypothetical protein ACJX0J_038745, partial [Zea mays]
ERRHPVRFLGTGVDSRPRPPPARVPGEMECGEPEEVQEVQGAAGPAREEQEEQREEREDDPGQVLSPGNGHFTLHLSEKFAIVSNAAMLHNKWNENKMIWNFFLAGNLLLTTA